MIAIIAAMDRHRVIGKENSLPWRLPADLSHFRELTWGHTVIMGRKTMESLGRPLPGRKNLVLTHNPQQHRVGFTMISSIKPVLKLAEVETVFVIGGESVYHLFLPYAQRIYLTVIDESFQGDAYFPQIDPGDWQMVSERVGIKNNDNPYPYVFRLYQRL